MWVLCYGLWFSITDAFYSTIGGLLIQPNFAVFSLVACGVFDFDPVAQETAKDEIM